MAKKVTITGVLLKRKDKILLVCEKKEPEAGLWNIPAGHVDEGETILEAAKREGEEESGFTLEVGKEIKTVRGKSKNVTIYVFEAKILGGKIKFDPEELTDVRWFSKKEIMKLPLREPFISNLV